MTSSRLKPEGTKTKLYRLRLLCMPGAEYMQQTNIAHQNGGLHEETNTCRINNARTKVSNINIDDQSYEGTLLIVQWRGFFPPTTKKKKASSFRSPASLGIPKLKPTQHSPATTYHNTLIRNPFATANSPHTNFKYLSPTPWSTTVANKRMNYAYVHQLPLLQTNA